MAENGGHNTFLCGGLPQPLRIVGHLVTESCSCDELQLQD